MLKVINNIKKFTDGIKLILISTFQLKKFKFGFYLILRFFFDTLFIYSTIIQKYKKIKIEFDNKVNKNYNLSYNWFGNNVQIWFHYLKILNFLDKKKIKFLEIGSFEGLSILYLSYLYGDRIEIDSVDILKKNTKHYKNFLKNTKNIKKLTFFNMWSKDFFAKVHKEKQYDIIYIDASHYYEDVFFDAKKSFQLLKKRGIIIFDDLIHNWTHKRSVIEGHIDCHNVIGGVLLFLDYMNKKNMKFKIIYVGTQLIVKKM